MFDWREYLALAHRRFENPPQPQEAASRTIASRAYYAAFHRCRLMLPERERGAVKPGSHRDVLRALRRQPEMHAAADTINRLLRLRVHADYEPGAEPPVGRLIAIRLTPESLLIPRSYREGDARPETVDGRGGDGYRRRLPYDGFPEASLEAPCADRSAASPALALIPGHDDLSLSLHLLHGAHDRHRYGSSRRYHAPHLSPVARGPPRQAPPPAARPRDVAS